MDSATAVLVGQIEKSVQRLRDHLSGDDNGKNEKELMDQRWYWLLRAVKGEGGRVLRTRWSELGRKNGYDPRALGGFFVGNGTMMTDGDWRVLSPTGEEWIERGRQQYGDGPSPFDS